jgi:tripartite-type tricarboxylate transporter receptor subunit TctC
MHGPALSAFRLAALTCATLVSFAVFGQGWPSKPIRLVLGYTTGGAADGMARPLIAKMEPMLGQPLVIEYRPGAGATVAAQITAAAAPDGYLLHLTDAGPMTIVPHVSKVAYDPLHGFTPIGLVSAGGTAIVAHPSLPASSLADLVRLARAQPGKLSYGTSGVAGAGHLAAELLQNAARIQLVHVAYKGGGPAMTDLLGGHVPLLFSSMGTAVPHIRSGKIRALAVTSTARVPAIPEVPTVAELGYPGFEALIWFGIVGPAKLPPEIVGKVSRTLAAALEDKAVQDAIRALGYEPAPTTPAQFAATIAADLEKWRKVVREANIKVE